MNELEWGGSDTTDEYEAASGASSVLTNRFGSRMRAIDTLEEDDHEEESWAQQESKRWKLKLSIARTKKRLASVWVKTSEQANQQTTN
jgi:hypothetical protein